MAKNVHEEMNHESAVFRSTRQPFTADALQDFLKSGWIFSVPSLDSKQILVGWGEFRKAPVPASRSGEASLFAPDFYLDEPHSASPWQVTPYWDLLDREAFATHVMSGVAHNVNGEDQRFQWVEPDRGLFDTRFEAISKKFKTGELKKAVPVVFAQATARLTEGRKLQILRSLLTPDTPAKAGLYLYGLWGTDSGVEFGMIGATPEILFAESDLGELQTVALAGTRGKNEGGDVGRDLLNDPKEREEHQFVIEDIRSVLSSGSEVIVGETGAVELPTLFHLKTPITARLQRVLETDEAARLLHPTPALGLAPRSLGFSEMKNWDDPLFRKRYGAPFGVSVDLGDGRKIRECVVAIRNIQWQDQSVILGSGCGVVPASQPDREWRELQLKRDSVKRLLGV